MVVRASPAVTVSIMNAGALLALAGAFVAAVGYGVGTIAQAVGVARMSQTSGPWQTKAMAGWPFAAGLCCDFIAYVSSFGALRILPLFLVESAIAASVAVTAVLAVVFLRQQLARKEVGALAAVVAGLVALSVSAEPGPAVSVGRWVGWVCLGTVVAVGLAVPVAGAVTRPRTTGTVLAFAAGVGFAAVGIASRLLVIPPVLWHLVFDPMAWAIVVGGGLALLAYGVALDAASVTTVAAVSFATQTVIPSGVGLVVLGDHIHQGFIPVAAAGFAATLAGCMVLASHAEVDAAAAGRRAPAAGI